MNKPTNLPRRLTPAERALVEAPEAKRLATWAVDLVRRHALSHDLEEMHALPTRPW